MPNYYYWSITSCFISAGIRSTHQKHRKMTYQTALVGVNFLVSVFVIVMLSWIIGLDMAYVENHNSNYSISKCELKVDFASNTKEQW